MPLTSYRAPNKKVDIGTEENPNSVIVEGLNANRISLLVQTLQNDLEAIFNLATMLTQTNLKDLSNIDLALGNAFFEAATSTPTVISTVIAICVVGEEDAGTDADIRIAAANRLPLSVQAKIVSAILELTFSEVGAIKKLVSQFVQAKGQIGQN